MHEIVRLSPEQRAIVEQECRQHCEHRGWQLWAINARSNHVHVVVTATEYSGKTVRDQLKANCTRGLRVHWPEFSSRPVWTIGGDWKCINDTDDLEVLCQYVREAQDRMDRE